MVEYLPPMHKALGLPLAPLKLDMEVFTYDRSLHMIASKSKFNKAKRCHVFIFSDLEYKTKTTKAENQ